ncbi:hypothetical protein [Nocardioides caldifontis]|uniref:hypothetical protein n=1 Tax=Nocardioides caldifontis TaxID=2588938 RepID=UPI0011DFEC25|nr:hypothetical protein [Nocardioides caldifontis]
MRGRPDAFRLLRRALKPKKTKRWVRHYELLPYGDVYPGDVREGHTAGVLWLFRIPEGPEGLEGLEVLE